MAIHPWKAFKGSGNNYLVKATQNNNKNSLRIRIDTFGKFWNCIVLSQGSFIKSDAGNGCQGLREGRCRAPVQGYRVSVKLKTS